MQNYRYKILEDKVLVDNFKCQIVQAADIQNPKLQLCAKITILSKDQDETTINNKKRELEERNIIRIYDFYDLNNKRYIIMEKCQMSLTTYIQDRKKNKQNFTLNELLDLIKQVSDGCKVLQLQQVLHRDIKPDNILVNFDSNNKPTYKISDFDISIQINSKLQTYNQQGTRAYKAPEIQNSEYSVEADVYSFGLALIETFFVNLKQSFLQNFKCSLQKNKFLFAIKNSKNKDDQQLLQQLKFNQLHYTVQLFLNKMLAYDPKYRCDWNTLSNECFKLISNNQLKELLQAPILAIEADPQQFTRKIQPTQLNQPSVQNSPFQQKQPQNQIQNRQPVQLTKVNQNHQEKKQFDQNIMKNNLKVPHNIDQQQKQQQIPPQQQFQNHNQQIPQAQQQQNQPIKMNQGFTNQGQPRQITQLQNQQPNNQFNQMVRNQGNANLIPANQYEQFIPQQQGIPTKVQYQTIQGYGQNFQQNRNCIPFPNVPYNTKQ